jgi:hypothetical protein
VIFILFAVTVIRPFSVAREQNLFWVKWDSGEVWLK